MPGVASLQAIGNWKAEIAVPMETVRAVTFDVVGQTGEQYCQRYIKFGAAAARKRTKTAAKNRPIERMTLSSGTYAEYVNTYPKSARASGRPVRVFKFQFSPNAPADKRLDGTWEQARVIANRGLAKRAWFWSLWRFGLRSDRSAIRGASRLLTINQASVQGYIKEVSLDYIDKAMESGWERQVETAVGNRLMGIARNRMQTRWRREVGAAKGAKITNENLARYFMRGES